MNNLYSALYRLSARPVSEAEAFSAREKWKYGLGHITGQARNRGSSELGAGVTIIYSRSSDLAKLNPICHMNYSEITEISFYPETSSCTQIVLE